MTSYRTENNVKNRFNSLMKRERLNNEDMEDETLIIRKILNRIEIKNKGQLKFSQKLEKKE